MTKDRTEPTRHPSAARCCRPNRHQARRPARRDKSATKPANTRNPAKRRVRSCAGRSLCSANPRATHAVAAKIRLAMTRCVASRYWLTSVRTLRPDETIHQPINPCRPPSARMPEKSWLQHRLQPSSQPEECQRQRKHQARGTRQKPVRPLPPEDRLERVERHALVDLSDIRGSADTWRTPPATRPHSAAG